jgi:hypothetical protein
LLCYVILDGGRDVEGRGKIKVLLFDEWLDMWSQLADGGEFGCYCSAVLPWRVLSLSPLETSNGV